MVGGVATAIESPLPTQSQIDKIMAQLSVITGFPVRRQLHFESISRREVASYLGKRAGETLRAEDLTAEQTALEMLGFVPHGFDLKKTSLDLMSEQAEAFYDYHRKALFLADWAPAASRDTAIVHELAHALADQSFRLERFTRKAENDSEKSTAREAVVEGQASYLMLSFVAIAQGHPALSIHPDVSGFDQSLDPTDGQYPIFDHAPLYIRMSLVFPYTWGMAFQSAVLDRLGTAGFREVFVRPPTSTREILHPEYYLDRQSVTRLEVPRAPHGYRTVIGGDLGELDHRVLIEQYGSRKTARRLSPECRGGAFRVVEQKKTKSRMLLYVSEWARESDAVEFLGIYRKCLAGKDSRTAFTEESASGLAGKNELGYFRVVREGGRVRSTEGSPAPL